MSSGICIVRLKRELKELKDNPLPGFVIHPAPESLSSRGIDIMHWIIGIPGLPGGDWEGCTLRLDMYFKEQYPSKPPKCQFIPPLYHPNIYPSGSVCLSILNEDLAWSPSITVRDILLGIQKLLDEYNLSDPAQGPAYTSAKNTPEEYKHKVAEIVRLNPSEGIEKRLREAIKRGEFRKNVVSPGEVNSVANWSTAIRDSKTVNHQPKPAERQKAKPSDDNDIIDISDGSDGLGTSSTSQDKNGGLPSNTVSTSNSNNTTTTGNSSETGSVGTKRRASHTDGMPPQKVHGAW